MGLLLLGIGVSVLAFIMPALYAALLVLFESIFGESVYIHVAVSAVFILATLYSIYIFIKNKPYREGRTDKADHEDNGW